MSHCFREFRDNLCPIYKNVTIIKKYLLINQLSYAVRKKEADVDLMSRVKWIVNILYEEKENKTKKSEIFGKAKKNQIHSSIDSLQ